MDDVFISHIEQETISWEATIKKVLINPGQDSAKLIDISFVFPEQGLTIVSDNGRYFFSSDDLALQGSVQARKNTMDMVTGSIFWHSDTGKIDSDGHVVITDKSFQIEGDGFEMTEDGTLILQKNVEAHIFE